MVLVTGIPGSGKTALLSFWRQQLKEQASDGLVIAYHFVGSTQASSGKSLSISFNGSPKIVDARCTTDIFRLNIQHIYILCISAGIIIALRDTVIKVSGYCRYSVFFFSVK